MGGTLKPVPVLLACHQLDLGGSERQLTETARALDRSRFLPHVATFHARGVRFEELRRDGIPVLPLPVKSFRDTTAIHGARILRRYVSEHGIRVLHSFDVPLNIFSTFSYAFGKRPVVLTSQRGHRNLTGRLYHRLSRVADRLTNGIVVNCDYMRRHLIEDENVRPELIDVCYNGLDTGRFSHGTTERPTALMNADPLIGTICALRPEKDVPTLIRAFAVVLRSNSHARLLVVGSGPELGRLQALAAELNIAAACYFKPAVSDVIPSLRMLDVFVLASREEAFSNAIMEAMACGVPVVASRVGGNPELTGEDERGLLFPGGGDDARLAELLLVLSSTRERRTQLAEAARAWVVNTLSLPAMAERMGEIYEKRLH